MRFTLRQRDLRLDSRSSRPFAVYRTVCSSSTLVFPQQFPRFGTIMRRTSSSIILVSSLVLYAAKSHVLHSALLRVPPGQGAFLPRHPCRWSPLRCPPELAMLQLRLEEHPLCPPGQFGRTHLSGCPVFSSRCVTLHSPHTSSVSLAQIHCSCRSRSSGFVNPGLSSRRPSSSWTRPPRGPLPPSLS